MTSAGRPAEIASLTGLRGLAALLVVVNHFAQWTRITPAPDPLVERLTSTAGIGMAVFFTLSGYVIALSYGDWDWHGRPGFNFVRLLLYRCARLFPAFVVFAALVVLRTPPLRDLADPDVQAYLLSRLALVYTWLPVRLADMLPLDDHFHVAWSLSVEAGLYVGFAVGAIVVASLPRWRFRSWVVGAAFFVGVWFLLGAVWSARDVLAPDWDEWRWGRWVYLQSPYGVSLQFALGVVACRLGRRLAPGLAALTSDAGGLALLAVYAVVVSGTVVDPWHQALLASTATALLMAGCTAATATNAALSQRSIVFVGTISYSLYLFHYLTPHLGFAGPLRPFETNVALYQVANFAQALGMAVILAAGMYWMVELPGRRAMRAAADRLLGIARRAPSLPQAAE